MFLKRLSEAVKLKPLHYPLWQSDAIDVSDVGPPEEASSSKRLEYKYVIKGRGVKWEQGRNRWAVVENERLTVHDGLFGQIQPYPFSFPEDVEVPEHSKEGSQWCIAILGSSVAEGQRVFFLKSLQGYNCWRKRGWAWHLGEASDVYRM